MDDLFETLGVLAYFAFIFWMAWILLKVSFQLCGAALGFNFGFFDDDTFWSPLYILCTWIMFGILYGLWVWIF